MKYVKLEEICTIVSGGTPSRSKPNYWNNGNIPWIKIKDMKSKYIDSAEEFITEEGLNNSSTKMLKSDTILYSIFATLGEVGILKIDACTNQAIAGLSLKEDSNILKEYLYYYLKSKKKDVNNLGRGVAQNNINLSLLRKFKIPVMPLRQQEKIVEVLDNVSSTMNNYERELELLDELVKARFVEMFGNPVLGTEKWPIHTVDNVAEAVDPQPSHRTPPIDSAGIPYVSIKDCDLKSGNIDFKGARKVSKNVLEEHLKRYDLHGGDFIIGKIGTVGNPIFVPQRRDYVLSANVVLVQPNKSMVRPYFLKYSFESEFVKRQFDEAKNSTSQAAFGIQKVRLIRVMNPSLCVQDEFEKFAIEIDKSRSRIQKSLEASQELFDSLMQEYFG